MPAQFKSLFDLLRAIPDEQAASDHFTAIRWRNGPFLPALRLHSAGEYVHHFCIHTNGIESVWALLKRHIIGVHHWVSPKHLCRYLDEMMWRFNRRDQEDADRLNSLLAFAEGRRLTYQALVA